GRGPGLASTGQPHVPGAPGARVPGAGTPGQLRGPQVGPGGRGLASTGQPRGTQFGPGGRGPGAFGQPRGTQFGARGPGAFGQRLGAGRLGTSTARIRQVVPERAHLSWAINHALLRRPMPGERGFTRVPPRGETRFIPNEMVFHVPAPVSQQTLDGLARRYGLSAVASHASGLTGGTVYHFRIADGRQVADVIRALEAENVGTAQPNYVFT